MFELIHSFLKVGNIMHIISHNLGYNGAPKAIWKTNNWHCLKHSPFFKRANTKILNIEELVMDHIRTAVHVAFILSEHF
jgi:hypothetical protein